MSTTVLFRRHYVKQVHQRLMRKFLTAVVLKPNGQKTTCEKFVPQLRLGEKLVTMLTGPVPSELRPRPFGLIMLMIL